MRGICYTFPAGLTGDCINRRGGGGRSAVIGSDFTVIFPPPSGILSQGQERCLRGMFLRSELCSQPRGAMQRSIRNTRL